MERNIEEIKKPEQVVEDNKSYLLTIFEADTELNIGVTAKSILEALVKFAQVYKDECKDWNSITFNIQEIEIIQ